LPRRRPAGAQHLQQLRLRQEEEQLLPPRRRDGALLQLPDRQSRGLRMASRISAESGRCLITPSTEVSNRMPRRGEFMADKAPSLIRPTGWFLINPRLLPGVRPTTRTGPTILLRIAGNPAFLASPMFRFLSRLPRPPR